MFYFILFVVFTAILYPIVLFIYNKIIDRYFESENFLSIKNRIDKYTLDCNDLNDHIERLKSTYIVRKSSDYGESSLSDYSIYNMKRKNWRDRSDNDFTHYCSSSVLNNSKNQPFKYLCKYFDINANEKTLENVEDVLNNFSAAEQGKFLLEKTRDEIIESIEKDIHPWILRHFKERTIVELGFKKIDLSVFYFPSYSFRYLSSLGNSSARNDIKLDISMLERFISYLSNLVEFKNSVSGQRALMTTKLREKIKQRDNFTCKICGLSDRDEKNLLLEIDHIIPLSKGGTTTQSNLQTLCWRCNRSKGSKIL